MELSKRTSQTRRSKAERAEIVERFQQSGLTRAAFAKQNGVAVSTLDYWRAQARSAPKTALVRAGNSNGAPAALKNTPILFGEVELTSLFAAPSPAWAMELVSARGLTIRCREALNLRELERLLRRC